MLMKTVFFEVSDVEREIFAKGLEGLEVSFLNEKLSTENMDKAKDAEVVCVFVNSTLNKEMLDALPALKFIATRSTGFDNIDCAYAASKGIKVSNVPAYGSHTVAEFTL